MFGVNQKVVCVDDSGWEATRLQRFTVPKKDEVYRVREVVMDEYSGIVCIRLCEIVNPMGWRRYDPTFTEPYWRASRFRPLIDRKTDISIFKKLLGPKVKEPEQV